MARVFICAVIILSLSAFASAQKPDSWLHLMGDGTKGGTEGEPGETGTEQAIYNFEGEDSEDDIDHQVRTEKTGSVFKIKAAGIYSISAYTRREKGESVTIGISRNITKPNNLIEKDIEDIDGDLRRLDFAHSDSGHVRTSVTCRLNKGDEIRIHGNKSQTGLAGDTAVIITQVVKVNN